MRPRVDRAAHTSEVRFTDRIFKFHKRYADEFRSDTVGGIDTTLLYSMVTGDWTHPGYGAAPAVRWTTSPSDIAILVTATPRTSSGTSLQFLSGPAPHRRSFLSTQHRRISMDDNAKDSHAVRGSNHH